MSQHGVGAASPRPRRENVEPRTWRRRSATVASAYVIIRDGAAPIAILALSERACSHAPDTGADCCDHVAMAERAWTVPGSSAGPVWPGGGSDAPSAGPQRRNTGTPGRLDAGSRKSTDSCAHLLIVSTLVLHGPSWGPARYRLAASQAAVLPVRPDVRDVEDHHSPLVSSPRSASRCHRGSGGRRLRSRIRGRSSRTGNRYGGPRSRPALLNQTRRSRRKRAGPDLSCSLEVSLPLQGRPCGRPAAALQPGNDTTATGRPASPIIPSQ